MKIKNDSKELRMESKLYGGTLLLAGDNIMTNEVQFLGGSLAVDAGKTNNNLGALTASKAGMLTVGAGGSLGFASFTAGSGLAKGAVTIDAPMEGDVLRFGTALGRDCKYFRWKDASDATKLYRVYQDADGYVHPKTFGGAILLR